LSGMMIEHPLQDQQRSERVRFSLRQAIVRLTLMESRNAMARSGLQVLKICYQKIFLSSQISTGFALQSDPANPQPGSAESTQENTLNDLSDHASFLVPQPSFELPSQLDVHSYMAQSYTIPGGYWQSPSSSTLANTDDLRDTPTLWLAELDQMVDLDPSLPINSTNWSSLLG